LNHMDGSRTVKIGQNGKPLAGQPELNARERKFVKANLRSIRNTVRRIGVWHRLGRYPTRVATMGAGILIITPGVAFADAYIIGATDALAHGFDTLAPGMMGLCPNSPTPSTAVGAMNNARVLDAIGGDVYERAWWAR